MLPKILFPEDVVRTDGVGPTVELGWEAGRLLVLTLGITRIIEQESLEIAIWGSENGTHWGMKPLVSFPQKFYCGIYSILLNLASNPDVRYLRAQWKMNRWARPDATPMFSFYLHAEESGARLLQTAAVA